MSFKDENRITRYINILLFTMCGIWTYLSKLGVFHHKDVDYYTGFMNIKERGPDRSRYLELNDIIPIKLGFHRLSIMDLSTKGDQPFVHKTTRTTTLYTLVNGEIYNYQKLIADHNLSPVSSSDCEVVPLLYIKYGFQKMISLLLGEWACIVVEIHNMSGHTVCYAARDPMGVRPLFYTNDIYGYAFSSEMKGLIPVSQKVNTFPPTYFVKIDAFYSNISNISNTYEIGDKFSRYNNIKWTEWYTHQFIINKTPSLSDIKINIRKLITEAVESRLESDRPIACLLSGGIDSSLVAAIAARFMKTRGKKIKTFSIGMPDSPDVYYAQKVADYIGSDHKVVTFDPMVGIKSIPIIIHTIESYDITTVRASTPHYLLLKWIKENTDIKVIYSGEYMDEIAGSYLYLHNAPTPDMFHEESVRLVKDIYLFDSLRADRCIAGNGIEARVPFSHQPFIEYYLSLDPELRIPRPSPELGISNKLEKAMIRESFFGTGLLPDEIVSRTKNAFSDAISHESKSWYQYIEDYTNISISDEEFETRSLKYPFNTPVTKEAYYYRMWFETYFGSHNTDTIPYMWLPKWSGNVTNPSARVLSVYKETINECIK